jgi:hypothetical protein
MLHPALKRNLNSFPLIRDGAGVDLAGRIGAPRLEHLRNVRTWPSLRFKVDLSDIFAHDSDAEKLDAAD